MASRLVSVTEEYFSINRAAVQNNARKATEFGNKLFNDMYFFNFLATNALKMCSKCECVWGEGVGWGGGQANVP